MGEARDKRPDPEGTRRAVAAAVGLLIAAEFVFAVVTGWGSLGAGTWLFTFARLTIYGFILYLALKRRENSESDFMTGEHERDFLAAIMNSPSMLSLKDRDFRYVLANPNFDRILGISGTSLIGKTDSEVFPAEVATHMRELDEKVMRSLERVTSEDVIPASDGSLRTFASSRFPISDEEGRPRLLCNISVDITARRLVEQELRQTLEILSAVMNSVPDMIYVKDLESRVIFANKALINFMQTTEAELRGNTGMENIGDQARVEEILAADQRIMHSASGESIQEWVTTKSGERFCCLTRKEPWRDAEGRVIGLIGISSDITAQIHAKELLTLERDKLEAVISSVSIGIGLADANGQPISLNPAGTKMLGFKEGEPIFNQLEAYAREFELQYPDGRPMPVAEWPLSRAMQGEFVRDYDARLARRSTGDTKYVSFSVVPLKNSSGSIVNYLFNMTDFTHRKQAEEALRESQATLTMATSAAEVGIWERDLRTGKVHTSEIQARILELPGAEVMIDDVYGKIFPEDRTKMEEAFKEAIEHKKDYSSEFRFRKNNGSVAWIFSRGRAVYDVDGKPVRMYGASFDITGRKQAEENLREAVNRANEASELKSAFLANMSHEIRTPLGAILGFTDLLREPALTPEEAESYHSIIKRNGEQLSNLINDILDLSKVEAGLLNTEKVSVKPSLIVEDVCADLSVKAQQAGIELHCRVADNVPASIGTDPTRLKQILSNVIGNAIKFTRAGSVTLVATQDSEKKIHFTVADTGIGITKAQAKSLFQPFSQADASTTRKYGGTGLGLVLSRRLARALGGDLVLVSSEPGKGSVFDITIANEQIRVEAMRAPVQPRLETAASPQATSVDKRLEGVKVLLVEDSLDNQHLISRILSKQGASIGLAQNGLEGVERALAGEYDVVLMDIQMPVMDGYSATASLRERGYNKPIIALTAHAMSEVRVKTSHIGCNDYMTKPIKSAELIQKISQYSGR